MRKLGFLIAVISLTVFAVVKSSHSQKWRMLASKKNFDLTNPKVASDVRKLSADIVALQGGQPYIEARKAFEAKHPAYAHHARAIRFSYKMNGLTVNLQEGPYGLKYNEVGNLVGESCHSVEKVEIHYDPSKFSEHAIIRDSFGNKALSLTEQTLQSDCNTMLASQLGGMFLSLNFKALDREQPDIHGPRLFVSRDTGQLRLWLPKPGLGTGDVAWNIVPAVFESLVKEKRGYFPEETDGAFSGPEPIYGTWFSLP